MNDGVLERPCSLWDIEQAAAQILPADVRDFIAGGAGDETVVAANRTAFDSVRVVPRALVDVSVCDTSAKLLGSGLAMPLGIAPMAYQQLVHPNGELALAAAARDAGVAYTACTLSSVPIEQITAVGAETWFQLYWMRDRMLVADLVRRAELADCTAIMLTVDAPRMGRRLRDLRHGFSLPAAVRAANLSACAQPSASRGGSAPAEHALTAFDPSLSWADLDWLRSLTSLPLVLKGVLDPRDAATAASIGVEGLVVSNHGGRQLDCAVSSIDALEAICHAVEGRATVLLDSGIRSGTDVLRALAMGAAGVLLGRPALWGLALDGREGALAVLDLIREELRTAMPLAGCASVATAALLETRRSPSPCAPAHRASVRSEP